LSGRSRPATTEELLLTSAVGEAIARPVGYASVADTDDVLELPPPEDELELPPPEDELELPPPHPAKKTSVASEIAEIFARIIFLSKNKEIEKC
jgi:hypothetical protein